MDRVDLGFRPSKKTDRSAACVCRVRVGFRQYIEATYGHDAILQMLEQFRVGKAQDEVFQIVLHKSESQFFDEFLPLVRSFRCFQAGDTMRHRRRNTTSFATRRRNW